MNNALSATPSAFVAALQAGDPVRAAAVAQAMLTQRVPLGTQWQGVARFAATESEWGIAVEAMRRFVLDDPHAIDRRLALAEVMTQAGRTEEVADILTPIAQRVPNDARIRHLLGIVLIESGRRDEGVEHLRAAIALRPTSGATWIALANAKRFIHGDADFATLAGWQDAPRTDRAGLAYAYGKALDDLGEHDRAFAAFAAGARLVAADRPYDAAADRAAALATIRGIAAPSRRCEEAVSGRAILVTGKPRSGTTLVEQILAAHSVVTGGGEINIQLPAMRATQNHSSDRSAAFAARYAHLLSARFGAAGRIVDKSLNASRFAAMTRDALPDTPLIWLRRDPLDTAWSSFRTFFAQGVEWSFDLVAMAHYHAIEDALHAFWREHYGARLLTLSYAELVDSPRETVTRLLGHCGLAEESGVHDFSANRRVVQTASVDQVRRPINREGLDRAAPYAKHLAPYERAYAEARRTLGLPVHAT